MGLIQVFCSSSLVKKSWEKNFTVYNSGKKNRETQSQITIIKRQINHWLRSTFIEWINRQPLVKRETCLFPGSTSRKMSYSRRFLITILLATYRFCDLANHRCHTLCSWCNSNMASASALVDGSSDEPIRLMVSATQTSSSCRSAWNLCSVHAAARALLRRWADCCNECQFSWSSDSLLRIGADRYGCLCNRRRASSSCPYWNQMKCMQYTVSMQISGLKWQVASQYLFNYWHQDVRPTFMLLVLHGCEIWLVIMRREQTLRIFAYRVLRKIFGPKRKEVIGDCWQLHSKELCELYCSRNTNRNSNQEWDRQSIWNVSVKIKCI